MKYDIITSSEINQSHLLFWQGQIWSNIITESGQAKESFYYGNKDSTILCIEIRSIGLGLFGAFALGVVSNQIGKDWDIYMIDLCDVLREKGVLFLQIEPMEELGMMSYEGGVMNNELGITTEPYKKFLTPYTRVLDLTQSEDELLAQMHEKGRYNIRTAIKKGVQIEKVSSTKENIDIWMQLLNDTLSRDNFSGNSTEYYTLFIKNIETQLQGGLYFAHFEGRVIAAGIFLFTHDRAMYYYGASSSDSGDKKVFAPYLLQWEAMKIAKNQGIPLYDFFGVSQPGIENDPLAGVSFFKSRFGGQVVKLPKKILISLSWKYKIFSLLKIVKNLKTRR